MSNRILTSLCQAAAEALRVKELRQQRDRRRAVARKVYVKQEKRLEDRLTASLEPLFDRQIKDTSDRLLEMAPDDDTEGTVPSQDVESLVSLAFDENDPQWKRELIDRTLPVLAVGMLEAATAQMMEVGIDPRERG